MRAVIVFLLLAGCGPLDEWNPPKVAYTDNNTGCPRYMHSVRGPDAYDRAHHRRYHCESGHYDPDFFDVDQVDQ